MGGDNGSTRMVSPYTEAFTLVILKNNYFAWLLDAKRNSSDQLMTDYDTDLLTSEHLSLAESELQCCYFDLKATRENQNFVVMKSQSLEKYEEVKQAYQKQVDEVREAVSWSAEYKKVLQSIETLNDKNSDERTNERKRRKVLKELKPFTGIRVDDEKAFRGWSGRTFVELGKLRREIEEDESSYMKFEIGYKHVYAARRNNGTEDQKDPGAAGQVAAMNTAQYNQLFDLSDDENEENVTPV
jgi:hypothetical protein